MSCNDGFMDRYFAESAPPDNPAAAAVTEAVAVATSEYIFVNESRPWFLQRFHCAEAFNGSLLSIHR